MNSEITTEGHGYMDVSKLKEFMSSWLDNLRPIELLAGNSLPLTGQLGTFYGMTITRFEAVSFDPATNMLSVSVTYTPVEPVREIKYRNLTLDEPIVERTKPTTKQMFLKYGPGRR